MKHAQFTVEVTDKDRFEFANLSGDFNPLHIDDDYAKGTSFKKCILHGAFSAGIISQMAGMYLPGTKCLLHNMKLEFKNPIYTPVSLDVQGTLVKDFGEHGQVCVKIKDAESGETLVDGSYEFGRHSTDVHFAEIKARTNTKISTKSNQSEAQVLITGAGGELGSSLMRQLEFKCLGVSRSETEGLTYIEDLESSDLADSVGPLSAIVHCAWPKPLNEPLLEKSSDTKMLTEYHLSKPIRECIALAKLLKEKGIPGAKLILIGSTFSAPGRHAWSFPYYSLSKSLVPVLVKILALELGATGHKAIGVNYDMLDGGMNATASKAAKIAAKDRSPIGKLPTMDEAALDLKWVLDNAGSLISGAVIDLSGGNIP
jgi:3-hydroxybutyryl-CoA dehydratase